jgi:hypothetical protein
MKTYFHLKDNVLDKKLAIVINSQTFTNHKQVAYKTGEIVRFYAEHFTKNKISEAEEQLENHNYEVRQKDAILISFFCGTISIIAFMFIVLLSIPDSAMEKKGLPAPNTGQELMSSMYTFRFLFSLIFLITATGVVVKVLKNIRVNYMFILELDP